MKGIIKIEEASMLVLAIIAFSQMELSWWWFVGLFLTPDIGMFGYVFNSKVGAWSYNFFHHRGLAILLYLVGLWMDQWYVALGGIVLFGHIAFDRMLGYGLKFQDAFTNTHLGTIGKEKNR